MINVNIKIKKSKLLLSDKSAFVYFPYDENILKKVKSINRRKYVVDEKCWEIPIKEINNLKNILTTENVFIHEELPEIEISKNWPFKLKPYEYQLEGIKYGLNHNKYILGDTQGLGKTMQSLNIAAMLKELYLYKHCLIICCVNGLKSNWLREIEQHTYLSGYILGTRFKKNGEKKATISSDDKIYDAQNLNNIKDYFLITNVESFRDNEFSSAIKDAVLSNQISTIIIDEVHKVKSPTSQVSSALLSLNTVKHMILLSGTIMVNSPLDLYMPMQLINIETNNFWYYRKHYCIFKTIKLKNGKNQDIIVGYKNLEELQQKLKNNMLKRNKDNLNLPDKIHYTEYLEMYPNQYKLYKQVSEQIDECLKVELNPNKLALVTRLRQVTSAPELISDINESIKLDRMLEVVEENILNNQKTIIFSTWAEVIKIANKRLNDEKINTAMVIKDIKDKMAEIDKFRTGNNCNVILGTVASLGTGYSLPEASCVIFLDSPFTDSDKQQAIDRAHRLTTKHNVTIINLVCEGTVDERVEKIVNQKVEMTDLIVGGKITSKGLTYLLE